MSKYLKAMKLSSQASLAYNWNFFISSLIQILSMLITLFMWKAVFAAGADIADYSYASMIVYIFVVNTVFELIGTNNTSARVSNDIRSGALGIWLLRPFPHFFSLLADVVGSKLPRLPAMLLMNGAACFLFLYGHGAGALADGGSRLDISSASLLMFLVFVLIGFLWNYLFDYLLGLVSFRADNPWILFYIKSHVTAVFCGLIIPLDLFPSWVRRVLDWLPFKYYVYYPFQVLTGQTTWSEFLLNLFHFGMWLMAAALCTLVVWKTSIGRFAASGG